MANTRDIRNRIKSVKNTAQITRAMQLVAASKMKRAQDLAVKGQTYADRLLATLASIAEQLGEEETVAHPYLEKREVKRRGILLVTTDRGLCGPLNSNLFREIVRFPEEPPVRWFNIGRKGRQYLVRTKRDLQPTSPSRTRPATGKSGRSLRRWTSSSGPGRSIPSRSSIRVS